jgi:hypothetical protein
MKNLIYAIGMPSLMAFSALFYSFFALNCFVCPRKKGHGRLPMALMQ